MVEQSSLEMQGLDKTALYVLVWKNEGSKITYAPHVYKNDPYMSCFFNDIIEDEAKKLLPKPESYRAVQLRRKHIKHTLSLDLKSEIPSSQIIFLGAGLDTLPIFKAKKWSHVVSNLSFFEIDKDKVLDYKQSIIQQYNLPNPSIFIRMDYTSDNFIEVLKDKGVNFNIKTHIVWEGNTYYLERSQLIKTLNMLRNAFAAPLSITFDYFTMEIINKQADSQIMEGLQDEFEQMGAKFKTGFDDIVSFAQENGFTVISNDNIPKLDKDYFRDQAPLPEPEDKFHYICTMQNRY